MRKTGILLIILAFVFTIFAAGCGSKQEAPKEAPKEAAKQEAPAKPSKLGDLYLLGATGGGGGVWDMVGTGIGSAITQKLPEAKFTFVPGNGNANVIDLSKGKGELALMVSCMGAAGALGQDPFTEKLDKNRAISMLYTSSVQIMVEDKYPLKNIKELKEKKMKVRIAVGDPGSTTEYAVRMFLEEEGITYKDIESWGGTVLLKAQNDAAGMMGDGLLDILCTAGTVPLGSITELASKKKMRFVEIDQNIIDSLNKKYGFAKTTVPAGAYNFVTSDVKQFGYGVILAVNADVPEDDVYKITKALLDNMEFVRGIHANLKHLEPKNMGSDTGVPLHPGAIKAYKEAGVM